MKFSFTAKTPFLYTLLLIGGAFFICSFSTTYARTVPVKEIIKTTDQADQNQIPLDETTVAELSTATTSAVIIAEKPLFLEKQTLTEIQRTTKTTSLPAATLYTWTNNYVKSISSEPEDAKMVFEGERVTNFSPGKNGLVPDVRATTMQLIESLEKQEATSPVIGITIHPHNTLADTNTLGITEFLSGGKSDFSNSSKNRLANIEAGIQQVKGVIVKPGETFSFGEYLGDVTAAKGFKPEIVIKAEGLVPELGGGICQVSSTLFRAVMQSGMQITQRRNHAFSVSHYFPPGTDATIYTPATDLKFINDTPAHVLIWPYYIDKTHLAFDLYGTKDSRSVVVDEPIQWDRKADGSMKASWSRHVTKDGITRDDVLKSNYLPPALFKKEEKFVVASPTTVTPPATVTPPTTIPTPPQTN